MDAFGRVFSNGKISRTVTRNKASGLYEATDGNSLEVGEVVCDQDSGQHYRVERDGNVQKISYSAIQVISLIGVGGKTYALGLKEGQAHVAVSGEYGVVGGKLPEDGSGAKKGTIYRYEGNYRIVGDSPGNLRWDTPSNSWQIVPQQERARSWPLLPIRV
jgi:hypothetical protein